MHAFLQVLILNVLPTFCQDIVESYTHDEAGQQSLVDAREKGDTFLKSNDGLLKKVEEDIEKIKKGPEGGEDVKEEQKDPEVPAPATPPVGTSGGRSSPSQAPKKVSPSSAPNGSKKK